MQTKRIVWLAFITLVLQVQLFAQQQDFEKANVIVILSDDAGYADFGCYGGTEIPTPNIDALAKEGVLFTNAYVTASVCAPSRAGLLTGRYQQRFGFEHNTSTKVTEGYRLSDVGMDPSELTIADEMRANGYKTIALGKWHLGEESKHFPLQRGFDEFYGFIGGARQFFGYKNTPSRELELYDNMNIIPESKVTYLTDMLTDRAAHFIAENRKQPFFMYLAYNAVHTPMNAQQVLMDRFSAIEDPGRRAYAAMMTSLDDGVGRIVQTLKEQGIDKNTLIIFLNDNGGATVNSSDNGGLRGMKGSKWEGGIRVPMIMRYPGHIDQNKKYENMVSALDILPTALAVGAGKQKGDKKLDGINLMPYLGATTQKDPHKALYWKRGIAAAVRAGNWKLIRVEDNILLFDLSKDVSESINLANVFPAKKKELLKKLAKWEKGLDKPHWESTYSNKNQIMKHRMENVGREMERMYP